MPTLNYNLSFALFSFLNKIQLKSEINKMNAENLSICIGPNILRKKEELLKLDKDELSYNSKIIKFIINNFSEIFDSKKLKIKN
jgi:hypothetical protein